MRIYNDDKFVISRYINRWRITMTDNPFIEDLEIRDKLLEDCFEFLNSLNSTALVQMHKLADCIDLTEAIKSILWGEE